VESGEGIESFYHLPQNALAEHTPWNPVKELKVLSHLSFLLFLHQWNPVKELKVDSGSEKPTLLREHVESGEGIERKWCSWR